MKYRVTYDGITKTYVALHLIAWHLLDSAKMREEGSALNLQAASVFYAFAFEAYLNHVGVDEGLWKKEERKSLWKKLKHIGVHLKLHVDDTRPPFETIAKLFDLRDTLAHARTQVIDEKPHETDEEPPHYSAWRIHEWERLTQGVLEDYAASVREAIEQINKARHEPDEELWNQGVRGRMVETIDKQRRTTRSTVPCAHERDHVHSPPRLAQEKKCETLRD